MTASTQTSLLQIDGAAGEGGGQILRNALALSVATGRPFEITRIRAGREKSGLLRQHLACVRAAQAVSGAEVDGAHAGSEHVRFVPGPVQGGTYRFAVGSAGSAVLVLQSVLPALLTADAPSHLTLEGGTHNPSAPTFEFFDEALLPVLRRMGPGLTARLERRGFYPAGGGRFTLKVEPVDTLTPIELLERGAPVSRSAEAVVCHLPRHIAEREVKELQSRLDLPDGAAEVQVLEDGPGPGNALLLRLAFEHATEVISGIGRYGRTAEGVARDVASQARRYLRAGVPVGRHLADQLVVPFALAGKGSFRTFALSRHTTTAIAGLRPFLDVAVQVEDEPGKARRVTFGGGE